MESRRPLNDDLANWSIYAGEIKDDQEIDEQVISNIYKLAKNIVSSAQKKTISSEFIHLAVKMTQPNIARNPEKDIRVSQDIDRAVIIRDSFHSRDAFLEFLNASTSEALSSKLPVYITLGRIFNLFEEKNASQRDFENEQEIRDYAFDCLALLARPLIVDN